jgi:hypothetical protein
MLKRKAKQVNICQKPVILSRQLWKIEREREREREKERERESERESTTTNHLVNEMIAICVGKKRAAKISNAACVRLLPDRKPQQQREKVEEESN